MAVQQGVASHATPNAPEHSVSLVRAARELQLKPRQFDLAVQLGEVGTLSGGPGGRLRVAREEIDRHRSSPGFPEALRSRLWVVGTAEGAELMGIGPARFVRLARGGCFAPVRFYVNRYRAVVWHYLAAEVVEFADHSPEMLKGRIPAVLKSALEENPDRRARGWRARRLDQLSARADGPWERAAVLAAVLDAAELARAVTDPAERAYISALSPALVTARPGTPRSPRSHRQTGAGPGSRRDRVASGMPGHSPGPGARRTTGARDGRQSGQEDRDGGTGRTGLPRPGAGQTGQDRAAGPMGPAAQEEGAGRVPGGAMTRCSTDLAEQPLLHHGHEKASPSVEDLTTGQPSCPPVAMGDSC
ncbi:DUF6397 family protein [Streptomyces olivoverticillatus]